MQAEGSRLVQAEGDRLTETGGRLEGTVHGETHELVTGIVRARGLTAVFGATTVE